MTVVFCHDTDVFDDFLEKPPINWNAVETSFLKEGVKEILHIKARRSIEDWFLYDLEGILHYLHLPKNTKPSGPNGYIKLKHLFAKSGKMYFKGKKADDFISHINIEIIVEKIEEEIKPLYILLGMSI